MGIVAGLGAAAAAASLAGSVSNLAGGGSSGGANGTYGGQAGTYIPSAQPAADQQYQGLLSNLGANTDFLQGYAPNLQNDFLHFSQNNPFIYGAQAGAAQGGAYGTNTLAPMQEAGAGSLQNLGDQFTPYGSVILQSAFDPQTTLYNNTAQKVLGQSAVANAQAGVQGPAAAGVTDNNINNFNTQWQTDQLSRQLQGIQGYGSLINSAGQAYSGASGLGGSAVQNLTTSGALPYSTYLGEFNDIYGQYSNLANATTTSTTPNLNALQSYLQLGQSASGLAQSGANSAFNQNQQTGAGIGSALGSLANNQGLQNLFGPSNENYASGIGSYGYVSQPDYYSAGDISSFGNAGY